MVFDCLRLTLPILTSFSRTGSQFGSILGHLGPIFGPSWEILGPSLAHLGPLWRLSWAVLGPSWGHVAPSPSYLEGFLGYLCHLRAPSHLNRPFWTHLGPSWSRLGPCLCMFGPMWADFEAYFKPPRSPCWDIFLAQSTHSPQVSKGGGGASPQASSITAVQQKA